MTNKNESVYGDRVRPTGTPCPTHLFKGRLCQHLSGNVGMRMAVCAPMIVVDIAFLIVVTAHLPIWRAGVARPHVERKVVDLLLGHVLLRQRLLVVAVEQHVGAGAGAGGGRCRGASRKCLDPRLVPTVAAVL